MDFNKVLHFQGQGIHRFELQLLAGQMLFGKMLAIMLHLIRRKFIYMESALQQIVSLGRTSVAVRAAKSMAAKARDDQTCIRRTASRLTRDTEKFATQPHSNWIRALAMSSSLPTTFSPTASILRTSLWTIDNTRSKSWIIRSSTTPISVERNVNPLVRTVSIYFGSAMCGDSGGKSRIETLHVADLQHQIALLGQGDQFIGFGWNSGTAVFPPIDARFCKKILCQLICKAVGAAIIAASIASEKVAIIGNAGQRHSAATRWRLSGRDRRPRTVPRQAF